ncbi:DUF2470 domain-containing protein [Streptomyces sp. SCSIO 30461]|uniref:DUF2470 domain-containing protein n=1 Tax=Streptomyces sp. SCSIO 30461 TaxID=3118085 RepID=UPI0030D252F8
MALADVRVDEPTAAERIRSVVLASGSLTLATGGTLYELTAMHTVDGKGRLRLHAPAGSRLAAEAVSAPRGVLAGLAQFTDIAPVAVRERVRARVALSGWLTPADIQSSPEVLVLRLDTARAVIETDAGAQVVGLDELVLAQCDPLAAQEAALLCHLDHAHRDVVDELGRTAAPLPPPGALRIRPLALDRHGFILRYELRSGHLDVRVAFPEPVSDPSGICEQVELLLTRVRHGRHRQTRGPRAGHP